MTGATLEPACSPATQGASGARALLLIHLADAPAPHCRLQTTGDAQCPQPSPCSSTACALGRELGTHCMRRHFGYGVSSTVSWQHGSGVDIKGCTSLLRLCMAAAGQCPSPRHLDTTICPHCCRSLRPPLTQLLPTKTGDCVTWGIYALVHWVTWRKPWRR